MGIERFFSSLSNNFNVITNINYPYKRLDMTHFYIDFNSIIHNISAQLLKEINNYKMGKIPRLEFRFNSIDDFNDLLISKVLSYIKFLVSELLIPDNIKYIMIAIDGVPSVAKMMEQKKRRYLGNLLEELMKGFELPVNWSKNNISPATVFMDKLSKSLVDDKYRLELKNLIPNLEELIVSDIYTPGEGEMKILDCLRNISETKENLLIYSPDSDMILLIMLLKINVGLIRYDQQKTETYREPVFNIIDISEFKKELIKYCQKFLPKDYIDEYEMIKEIIYLFSIFGDDFVPKLESVIISEDIYKILECYLITILESENNRFLIYDGKYKTNKKNLMRFFELMSRDEIKDLNRNFFYSKYKNYGYARTDNFSVDLTKFIDHIKKLIIKFIAANLNLNRANCSTININNVSLCIDIQHFFKFILEKYNGEDFNKLVYDKTGIQKNEFNQDIFRYILSKINKAKGLNDEFFYFIYNLRKLIDGDKIYRSLYLSSNLLEKRSEYIKKKIKRYKGLYLNLLSDKELLLELILFIYKNPNENPLLVYLNDDPKRIPYLPRSFRSEDHKRKLRNMNDREKRQYKIDFKLDDFNQLFRPTNPFYKSMIDSTLGYYRINFPDIDLNRLINQYYAGLEWVLEYYLNGNTDFDWFYPYARTPLISSLIKHQDKITKPDFDFNLLPKFTPLEAIIFVLPFQLSNISKQLDLININDKNIRNLIIKFIKENFDHFLPLDEIFEKLKKTYNLPELLDCSSSIFISKCHLKLLEKNVDPKKFRRDFRKYVDLETQNKIMKNKEILICPKF